MQFKKYQHIEKLGRPEVEGILSGDVYIFDKLDGTNVSVYLNDAGEVEIASRKRVLSPNDDNRGAAAYVNANDKFQKFFAEHPNLRLFGEWLVPHTLRNYNNDAWEKLYIFDVMDGDKYLHYEVYKPLLEEFGIEFIPAIDKLFNPTEELVQRYLAHCNFLISEGRGEGIVIKNYDFVNKFGKTIWAKIVNPLAKAAIKLKRTVDANNIEGDIVEKFLTPELVEKEFAKIVNDNGGEWNIKFIGKLLGCVWHTFVVEETFNILKKFHNPKIDFALLNNLVVAKTKEIKADLFS